MEANGSCRACFHAETVMRRGRCGTEVNMTLSVIAARCQIPLFVTCGDIFPRPGEVFPQSGSPWQSTQSSSLCQGLSL